MTFHLFVKGLFKCYVMQGGGAVWISVSKVYIQC